MSLHAAPPGRAMIGARAGASWVGVPAGLALVTLMVAGAAAVHRLMPDVSVLVVAVLFGVALANCGVELRWARAGLRFAAKRLLRVGVALLGFQLAVGDVVHLGWPVVVLVIVVVACTFLGTQVLGRALGVDRSMSLLVAAGFAICGASAIAAVEGVAEADEDEVAFAVALVTLCGTLCIAALPLAGHLLGLDTEQFGTWVGASVHDVGQVVATASTGGPEALRVAVVVKLARVVLLAPIVVGTGVAFRRRARRDVTVALPPVLPLFVGGFLAATALRTVGLVGDDAARTIKTWQDLCLAGALVGLGSGVVVARLRRLGGRPFLLGALAWAVVASTSLAGVVVLVR